jgi:hypothetical protein
LSLAQASRVHPLTVIHPLSYTHNGVIQPSVASTQRAYYLIGEDRS